MAVTAVFAGVFAGPASAHAELEDSTPAADARIVAPDALSLVFSERLRPSLVKVQLTGPAGGRFQAGAPRVDGTKVTQDVSGPLAAGPYAIEYRVVSVDGHPVAGRVRFTVTRAQQDAGSSAGPSSAPSGSVRHDAPLNGGQAGPPGTESAGSPAGRSDGTGEWLMVGGVVAAGAALGAGVMVIRRRRGRAALGGGPGEGG